MFYVRAIAVNSKLLTFYRLVSFADLTAAVTTITVVSVSLEMFFSRREDNYVFSRQFLTRY